jgi:STE24 endopeptidase
MSNDTQVKAKKYQKEQLSLGLMEEMSTLLFLMIWVWIAPFVTAALTGLNRYLQLILFGTIMYASYQVALFAFDYLSGYKLEHKYNLSTENFGKWLWRHTKSMTLSGLMLGAMVALLFTAVWYLEWWYLWCWLGWILLSIILAQVFPILILPIFYTSKKLENESLVERLRKLSEGTGVKIEGVYNLELSQSTKKGNAMLAGLGKTRRVLLGDTLLDKLSEEQIEVVYAHELGHHVHHHFRKNLTLLALASVALFALIYVVLGSFSGSDPETVSAGIGKLPLMGLVLSLFSFFFQPIINAVSRYFERQADRYALKRTQAPEHFITAFETLAEQNLADPAPARWVVLMYYDHPPIHERIAMAKKEMENHP